MGRIQIIFQNRLDFQVLEDVLVFRLLEVHHIHLARVGKFEWNASPARLIGAPGSFQKLLEIVIHKLTKILAHLDDLLVHTKDHEQQQQILHQLFIQLHQHGLKINCRSLCSASRR
jgi:hypothetical protein